MKKVFIVTTQALLFREAIGVVEDTEKGHPGLIVAYGNVGRGKSEIAENQAIQTGAVYIRVQYGWSPLNMMEAISERVNGITYRTAAKCKKNIIDSLDARPRTILMDEADRLWIGNIEHLRDIHDLTGAPIAFIGEPSIYSKLSSRQRIWSRVTRTIEIGPPVDEDVMLFGLKSAGLKIDPNAAHQLTIRSDGDWRSIVHDTRDLSIMAKANQTQAITPEMVATLPPRKKEGPQVELKKGRA